jgi:hypothetical protein
MGKKNWNKIADRQFSEMPQDFQEDWGELRAVVYKR